MSWNRFHINPLLRPCQPNLQSTKPIHQNRQRPEISMFALLSLLVGPGLDASLVEADMIARTLVDAVEIRQRVLGELEMLLEERDHEVDCGTAVVDVRF